MLRPGGVVAFSDIRDHTHVAPGVERAIVQYGNAWQRDYNAEPFYVDHFDRSLAGLMESAGFHEVNGNHAGNMGVWAPNLGMPLRVGVK